jgi:hypothetical protein
MNTDAEVGLELRETYSLQRRHRHQSATARNPKPNLIYRPDTKTRGSPHLPPPMVGCPAEGATCCKDRAMCCPSEYPVCNTGSRTCAKSKDSPYTMEALPRTPATRQRTPIRDAIVDLVFSF